MSIPVDVIVTNHNYGRFVSEAIDSALAQPGVDVSVIAVDDGSTDDSAAVLARYEDRIAVVLKENGGQASAFNAGFARSQAPFVAFLDADDILAEGALARAAGAAAAVPEAVKVQWTVELADAGGRRTGALIPAPHLPMPAGDVAAEQQRYGFDLFWAATSGNLFRRQALERLLPMPEDEYRTNADWYLQHLSPLLGPVVSLREVGTLRRVHGANAYEQAATDDVDVAHVRESVAVAERTGRELERLAAELELPRQQMRAVSSAANRMISLRLDPGSHPVAGDSRAGVLRDGIRAAAGRDDVSPLLRAAFCCWFAATAVAPRPVARMLARWWLFPEQRRAANGLLALLHRRRGTVTS